MNNKYTRFALAAVVYTAFAVYLYRPYFRGFDALRIQDLFVANICLASLGAYVLSRRWVAGFVESFFAGAIYGFGPFAIGLAKFHPTAGFLFASIPWLFCPAVFGPEGKWRLLRVPLSLLPFLAIVLFFQVSGRFGLYPIPINLKLRGTEMAGLLAPLVAAKRNMTLVGFYHIPVAPLVMGLSMFLAPLYLVFVRASSSLGMKTLLHPERSRRVSVVKGLVVRRFGIIAIFVVATILSFRDSFLEISPVVWLAVSVLCLAVLIGAGMQGLISAGFADRKWILFAAIVMGILAIITLLLATKYFQTFAGLGSGYARLLTEGAKMYILGAITVAIFFFMTRHASSPLGMKGLHPERSRRVPAHLLKTGLLCVTMGLDIFLGARFVVDRIL